MSLTLTSEQILETIPQKFPFIFLDKVTEICEGKSAKGYKLITANDFVFKNFTHEDYLDIFPPVLIVEALSQLGIVVLKTHELCKNKVCLFGGLQNVKFYRDVTIGDKLDLEGSLIHIKDTFGQAKATARVNGEIVVEGTTTFFVTEKENLSP